MKYDENVKDHDDNDVSPQETDAHAGEPETDMDTCASALAAEMATDDEICDPYRDDAVFAEMLQARRASYIGANECAPVSRARRVFAAVITTLVCVALAVLMSIPSGGVDALMQMVKGTNASSAGSFVDSADTASSTRATSDVLAQSVFNYSESDEYVSLSGMAKKSSYYLANHGELTSVKLQSPWQSCWAFAALAALESSSLKQQHADTGSLASADDSSPVLTDLPTSPDYSERHVAWFSHETQSKASGGTQEGEGISIFNLSAGEQLDGGYIDYASTMFSARQGIVAESDEPYEFNDYDATSIPWYTIGSGKGDEPVAADTNDARNKDWSLSDAHVLDTSGVFLTDANVLPSPALYKVKKDGSSSYKAYDGNATCAIKQALVDDGAVAISYAADISKPQAELLEYGDGKFFSYENWAQYDNRSRPDADHSVAIVGWDDNYPATNFTGSVGGNAPGDGAWLCKNSWGSRAYLESLGMAAGDARRNAYGIDGTGFFWLSYYDHSITEPTVYSLANANVSATTDGCYQYDYLATTCVAIPITLSSVATVANIFTSSRDEVLTHISTRTYSPGSRVVTKVYRLGKDDKVPSDGTLVCSQSHVCTFGGFHVFKLDETVALKKGERFAVTQQVTKKTGNKRISYLNLETLNFQSVSNHGDATYYATLVANEGETYVRIGGSGSDGEGEGDGSWKTSSQMEDLVASQDIEGMLLGNAMIKAYTQAR